MAKARTLRVTVLVMMFTLCVAFVYANGTKEHSATSSSTSSSGTVLIGITADLTGAAALSGQHKMDGAHLAVDQINANGGINGKKLKLMVEDNAGNNQQGVSAYEKMAADPNIVAVVDSIRSTVVQATLPYIARDKIPTMIGGTDPALTHVGNHWVFRCRPNDLYAADVMAKYITSDLHGSKVAILYDTDAFGSAGNALLKMDLRKDGATVVSDEGYTTGTKDYTSYLENFKAAGANFLGTYMTNSEDEAQMLRQFRQMGMTLPVLGSPSIAAAVTVELAKSAVNGLYGVSDFVANGNPEASAFTKAYEAKYNSTPDLFGGWAYDAINILAKVIAKDGTNPQKIRQGILSIKGYKGVEGTYNFDQNGDGLHGYTVVKWVNEKIVPIKHVVFHTSLPYVKTN